MPPPINESTIVRQHRPISCAECRRLKLRCNRSFPCTSCERRGCAALCPDGVLPVTRKANIRKPCVATAEKDETAIVDALSKRIRELENELATLQASRGSESNLRPSNSSEREDTSENTVDALTENFGTMSMTGYGKSRFFGTDGGALEGLNVWNHSRLAGGPGYSASASDIETCLRGLPTEIIYLSSAFLPRQTPNSLIISNWMVANLPPLDEAWNLCDIFFENGSFIFVPVLRAMFMEEIFSFFYDGKEAYDVDIPRGHRLALLYMIFALAELYDLNKPARPTGGNRFYYLARAALALEPFYDQPTLTGVQAHVLMCVFLSMSDHSETMELVYSMSATNVRLSYTLGLHREWQKFNQKVPQATGQESHIPKPCEEEIRRIIFLVVIHFELWQCLQLGRPSQLNCDHFDFVPPGTSIQLSSTEMGCMKTQIWAYGFLRDCAVPVLNSVVAIKPPNYSEVIKLEKKIEDYPASEITQGTFYEATSTNERKSRGFRVLQFAVYSHRETFLLCLHRQYFAFAMTDYSKDPLGCPYARSVFVCFVNACRIVSKISLILEKEPKLSVRIYIFWTQLIIPSLIFGTIVVRSPGCNLASTALAQLDKVCEILHGASEGFKAASFLPHTIRLREKARAIYGSHYSLPGTVPHAVIDILNDFPIPGSHGSPPAFPDQDSQVVEHSQGPPTTSAMIDTQTQLVEHLSMVIQPTEVPSSQMSTIDYSQWNINNLDPPQAHVNYNGLPEMVQSTNPNEEIFLPAQVAGDPQDWTNQLLSLFPSETGSFGFESYLNMSYPDPPVATQHTTWETFLSHMLQ